MAEAVQVTDAPAVAEAGLGVSEVMDMAGSGAGVGWEGTVMFISFEYVLSLPDVSYEVAAK